MNTALACANCGGSAFRWNYPGYYRCATCDNEGGSLYAVPTSTRLANMRGDTTDPAYRHVTSGFIFPASGSRLGW